jgi:hypothetical protein
MCLVEMGGKLEKGEMGGLERDRRLRLELSGLDER